MQKDYDNSKLYQNYSQNQDDKLTVNQEQAQEESLEISLEAYLDSKYGHNISILNPFEDLICRGSNVKKENKFLVELNKDMNNKQYMKQS